MSDEVSVRALDLPLRYLQRRQIPLEPVLGGLGLPASHFFDQRCRIDWSMFVVIAKRVAASLGGAEHLTEIGPFMLSAQVWRPFKFIIRQIGRQQAVYRWVEQRGGKLLFSHFETTFGETDQGVRFHFAIPPQFEPCEEFFLINKGVFAALPTMMGYPPALVRMETDGRQTTYEIALAPNRRLKDVVVAFFQGLRLNRAAAAAELERQLRLLEQQNRELQEAKRAVDELNRDLERRVEERTRQLSQARDQLTANVAALEAAMAARDRLFANLNHEFRTPLSLILLPVDRMLREPVLEPFHPRLRIMESNARRLLKLVDGILEIAASREGRLEFDLQSVDVAGLVRKAMEAYGPAAERLGLTLKMDVPDSAVVVGDLQAIGRILDNLLGNAIKYTPRDGTVTATVQVLGDALRLSVRDTGVGIAPEDQQRIFERFERSASPVAAGASSSGIGLALVQELAKAHGGGVAVTSVVGEGSTFEVTLPTVPTEALLSHRRQGQPARRALLAEETPLPLAVGAEGLARPAVVQVVEAPKGAPLLLIVEDNPDLRSQMAEILAPEYQLVFSENGARALAILEKRSVDVIVSDLVMPGMDGIQLVKELRRRPAASLVPFLLVTAVHDRKTLVGALDAGADDFLVKPFNEAELLGRVRTQLRLRSLARALADTKRDAAVGLMLSSMAHELRNPLNVLMNGMEPLRESIVAAGLQDEGVTALVDALDDAGRRVGGLSEQLLAFRRAASDPNARVAVPALIDQSLALLRSRLEGVALQKEIRYSGEVRGSGQVLSQVVVNLVENAIQATGGKGPVGIETREEADEVVLDVWDSGPGVSAENRDRIFEPFFSTKKPGEGTGLGLAISRQIAEQHGGHLALAQSDRGARFRLTLPRAAPGS